MDTIRMKIDEGLFKSLQENGFKVEWAEHIETDETNEMFDVICMDEGDIWDEYNRTQATFEELKKRGVYDYFPTFEWQINQDYWYTANIYEIIRSNN